MIPRLRPTLAGGCVGALVLGVTSILAVSPAAAATGADFDAGMIISDAQFYDSTSMDVGAVQAFLDDTGSACLAGYVCLRDYTETTNDRPAEPSLCTAYDGRAQESSAEIFVRVGLACGINPQTLIVLVQKEQGLVTDTSPTSSDYDTATGYGCPDGADCDSQYYGFFNQVYSAAHQFTRYAAYESNYSFRAGRSNTIRYDTDVSCGSSSVYIDNQATAGLYNYTPYQPDAAALADLYGTGDSCSAYGNRNFWRDFTDWFGSATPPVEETATLVRGPSDPTAYVLSGDRKYRVVDAPTLASLAPLGPLAAVPDSVLVAHRTGPPLGRMFVADDGGVYFFDLGVKRHVPTCDMVADYGASCARLPVFTDDQVADFGPGPDLTALYQVPTRSARLWITDGHKREIYDDQSAAELGLGGGYSTFSENALDNLSYAAPVIRANVLAQSRATAAVYLYQNGTSAYVPAGIFGQTPVGGLALRPLDAPSLAHLARAPALTGFVRNVDAGTAYVLVTTGKAALADPAEWAASYASWSPSMLALLAPAPGLSAPTPVKAAAADQVYEVSAGEKRPVQTWAELQDITASPSPTVTTLPDDAMAALPTGPRQAAPGALVQSPTSDEVFLLDGLDSKIPLISMSDSAGLGLWPILTLSNPVLDTYARSAGSLSVAIRCGANRFIGVDGDVLRVDPASAEDYGLTYTNLSALTCAALDLAPPGSPVLSGPLYLKSVSSPTVYQVSNDRKRAVADWDDLLALNGGVAPVIVTVNDVVAAGIPTGPPLP